MMTGKRFGIALDRFEIAQHDHQQIVEIMCDAAAELPDGLHFLRGCQLLLGLLEGALRLIAVRDVPG
jgi:hypothetical protein